MRKSGHGGAKRRREALEPTSIDDLKRLQVERYGRFVELLRLWRGRQRPRDREEVLLLLRLAVAGWRRGEKKGELGWLPDGRLFYRNPVREG